MTFSEIRRLGGIERPKTSKSTQTFSFNGKSLNIEFCQGKRRELGIDDFHYRFNDKSRGRKAYDTRYQGASQKQLNKTMG